MGWTFLDFVDDDGVNAIRKWIEELPPSAKIAVKAALNIRLEYLRTVNHSLHDKEYRDLYVAENIRSGLAFQIKAMREARGWTQQALGERTGMAQETISQLEDPDYGRLTIRTLRRLASAFDVALAVRFEPFSELVDWILGLSPDTLAVPSFENDCLLHAYPIGDTQPNSTGFSSSVERLEDSAQPGSSVGTIERENTSV